MYMEVRKEFVRPDEPGLLSNISDKLVTASWITGSLGSFFVVVTVAYMGCNKRRSRVSLSKSNASALGRSKSSPSTAVGTRETNVGDLDDDNSPAAYSSNCQRVADAKDPALYVSSRPVAPFQVDHSPDLILQGKLSFSS
jgi:hypothetical protein